MKYNGENIYEVIAQHTEWLKSGGARGSCADFDYANLVGENFYYLDLTQASMAHASLRGANLYAACLRGVNLQGADLFGANLCFAVLRDADLLGADLGSANLRYAYLNGAKNLPVIPMACPEEGAFIGYKVAINETATTVPGSLNVKIQQTLCIVTLAIPESALRSSGTGRKCRCDVAKVLKITDVSGQCIFDSARSSFDTGFMYRTGATVGVEDFDTNRWNECAQGIHFYLNRSEAVEFSKSLATIMGLSVKEWAQSMSEEYGGKA